MGDFAGADVFGAAEAEREVIRRALSGEGEGRGARGRRDLDGAGREEDAGVGEEGGVLAADVEEDPEGAERGDRALERACVRGPATPAPMATSC